MKTRLTLSAAFSLMFYLASSQVPQGFTYQAIARDGSGQIIANTTLPVRITIQTSLTGGTTIWEEEHMSVTSNQFGLISLVVGTETKKAGTAATFSAIDWNAQPLYLKTTIRYPGTAWTVMGTTQLWSVPYSMVAKDVEGPITKLGITGTTTNMEEALFEVKNRIGQTVFAVYNEGVRVYVDNGTAKAAKGGFAVGGFNTGKAESQNYFYVDADSIRAYIYDDPAVKAAKGGFAVGGYNLMKSTTNEYVHVSPDSIRMYIDDTESKAAKGGFAVGGFGMRKGPSGHFLDVATDANGLINPSENRVLWYPLKNAFLTGKVLIQKPDSVGENSFASGYESKAVGDWSQALGYKSIARGDYSTAIGKNAVARKINSFAFGESALAANDESYAFGRGAKAKGYRSFAFGSAGVDNSGYETDVTTAIGNYSFALGQGSKSIGRGSFSIGIADSAVGNFSTALGYYTKASGEFSIAMGLNNYATGTEAISIGRGCNASGGNAIAMGEWSNATQSFSLAMGYHATAAAYGSVAMGYQVSSSKDFALATGFGTTASGYGSTSIGLSNTASGRGSMAAGISTVASGSFSTALGYYSTAQCYASLVLGRYNTLVGLSNEWNMWDPIFVIGNGSSEDSRSNAMTVYKSGIADLGWFLNLNKSQTGAALKVNDSEAIWYDGTYYSWGYGGSYNVFADKVSVATTANPGSYALNVAGSAYCTGSWAGSDLRWKKDIQPLGEILPKLVNLQGTSFNWRTDEYPDMNFENRKQIGLVAQDVERIFPDLVRTDDNGYKAVSYEKLPVLLLEGIKEQQKQLEAAKTENSELKAELQELKEEVRKIREMFVTR